jgi:hypothetical protein
MTHRLAAIVTAMIVMIAAAATGADRGTMTERAARGRSCSECTSVAVCWIHLCSRSAPAPR